MISRSKRWRFGALAWQFIQLTFRPSNCQILSAPLPRAVKATVGTSMDLEPALLHEPTPDDAESLTSRLDPDTMQNEQTWPTEEEMQHDGTSKSSNMPDANPGTTPKRVKKVPRGTSAYQAAWIVDDDDDEDEEGGKGDDSASEGGDVRMDEDDETKTEKRDEEEEEEDLVELTEDMETDTRKSKVEFEDLDMDEDDKQ